MDEVAQTEPRPLDTNAVEWAKKNGRAFTFRCQIDNRPAPEVLEGVGYTFWGHPAFIEEGRGGGIILPQATRFGDAYRSVFVIQEASGWIRCMYVAGWHAADDYMVIHPYPLRPEWLLGPKRSYLIKVITGTARG